MYIATIMHGDELVQTLAHDTFQNAFWDTMMDVHDMTGANRYMCETDTDWDAETCDMTWHGTDYTATVRPAKGE